MDRLYKYDGVLSVLYHQTHFSIQKKNTPSIQSE